MEGAEGDVRGSEVTKQSVYTAILLMISRNSRSQVMPVSTGKSGAVPAGI